LFAFRRMFVSPFLIKAISFHSAQV